MDIVIREPDSMLHQQCEQVVNFQEAEMIAQKLLVIIKEFSKWWNRWLGFAANQIGYNKRIIVLRNGKDHYRIFVNPVLVEKRFPFPYVETCFSLNPKKYYLVKRYLWTKIKYDNLEGSSREMILRGPSAIYQEIDHLDGIMVSQKGIRIW